MYGVLREVPSVPTVIYQLSGWSIYVIKMCSNCEYNIDIMIIVITDIILCLFISVLMAHVDGHLKDSNLFFQLDQGPLQLISLRLSITSCC